MTRCHELPVRVFSHKSKKIKMKIRQSQSGGGTDGDWWCVYVCVWGGVGVRGRGCDGGLTWILF